MKSYVLHCPHLKRDIMDLLARVPNVQVITGYPTMPGEVGCLALHQEAVRRAMSDGAESCFVFEDDCKFTHHFSFELWETMAGLASALGYGAVHGGSVRVWGPELLHKINCEGGPRTAMSVLKVTRACSAHCMIYTKHGYDAVLNAEQPFDLSIADKGIKPLLIWPFVAIQRAGLSGIGPPTHGGIATTYHGPQEVNYEGLFDVQERNLGNSLGLYQ